MLGNAVTLNKTSQTAVYGYVRARMIPLGLRFWTAVMDTSATH